ncbi:MAG: hypothetical protein EHM20_14680 [Alphaproteobacteria bacterium]|nr:MAG: hypothetical protein EHM20_14680 [Alphaproteobacteria bacterium]
MKKLALFFVLSFMAFNLFAAAKTDKMDILINGLRTTCTVAGGHWDSKASICYRSTKADSAGELCGKDERGVVMYASNNTKYCCQAYDINKTGNQYSVHCDPL